MQINDKGSFLLHFTVSKISAVRGKKIAKEIMCHSKTNHTNLNIFPRGTVTAGQSKDNILVQYACPFFAA